MEPFTDAYIPEVVARVAYQLVIRCYKRHGFTPRDGALTIGTARDELPGDHFSLLDTALLAMQFHVIRGGRAKDWRAQAVFLSRAGCGFRRCFYNDYKAQRRR